MKVPVLVIGGALLMAGCGSCLSKESPPPPKDAPRLVEEDKKVSIVVAGMVKTLGLT